MTKYAIGLDFGTNSLRAIVVDVVSGHESGAAVYNYERGDMGVVTDPDDPHLARQHPRDYLEGIEHAVNAALDAAGEDAPDSVVGIGVDSTGSTPIPVDASARALALREDYADNPAAMAWLWKDHTSALEAEEITEKAQAEHPEYLAKCGGTYSSEWFWAKLLHCARVAPDVFDSAASWIELADWVPAVLSGVDSLTDIKRGICAAGHKAMFNPAWGGYPQEDFIASFDDGVLSKVRATLPSDAVNVSQAVGGLSADWAQRLGLKEGTPVAAGAFDAHLGAIGAGIEPGTLVKVIGTSTCDLAVAPLESAVEDIPGVCGVVPESVLPGNYGIEAGQSGVGDIFNWFVNKQAPSGYPDHESLNAAAAALKPGESGLLALDWHNGNRTILVDQRLTGLIVGLTLHSQPPEIYRALIEATAFGARIIRDRMREYGVPIERVIACGGIPNKSPLAMQIYANVLDCPIYISSSRQTCGLGAAMAGAVAAGAHRDFASASAAMTALSDSVYSPQTASVAVYERLYQIFRRLHDLFGTREYSENQFGAMKELIKIREEQRA